MNNRFFKSFIDLLTLEEKKHVHTHTQAGIERINSRLQQQHIQAFFVHLDHNSGPEKTQRFGIILLFFPEIRVKFPQNSGIRKHF